MHTRIPLHGLQRSWQSCPRWVNAGNQSIPSTHHPRRWNVTASMVGLKKKWSPMQPNMVNLRYNWECRRRRRKKWMEISCAIKISSDSTLYYSFEWGYDAGLRYAHMHSWHRLRNSHIHVLDGWEPATKPTPSMHHPWRQNGTTRMVA